MRKILLLGFTGLVLATGVSAQEVVLNFDGAGSGGKPPMLEPVTGVPAVSGIELVAAVLPSGRQVSFSGRDPAGVSMAEIDRLIARDMALAEKAGALQIAGALGRVIEHGSTEDKFSCAFPVKSFLLPEKYLSDARVLDSGSETWEYGEWEEDGTVSESLEISGAEICRYVTKRFCRLACRIVHGIGNDDYKDCRTECRNIIEKSCDHLDPKP